MITQYVNDPNIGMAVTIETKQCCKLMAGNWTTNLRLLLEVSSSLSYRLRLLFEFDHAVDDWLAAAMNQPFGIHELVK